MGRLGLLGITLLLLLGLLAPSASAHPLGNFTINHLSYVEVSSDRVDVLYVLDVAEIPTFREAQLDLSAQQLLERKRDYTLANLNLYVDGRLAKLRPEAGAKISFEPGQAGLDTTRVELPLSARVSDPGRVLLRDVTYDGQRGYIAIVPRPGRGTAVRTSTPRDDPTNGLRDYSGETLSEAPQHRVASFRVAPGSGTLAAPGGTDRGGEGSTGDGFAKVFEDASQGEGLFLVLLLAAFGWGALHALSPGHGKAMVAAYLVGTRGTARHALALGGIVTITHTIGVFALGLVTLLLAQFILPEDLYPWLNLVAGLLIVAVGAGVLRSRIRWGREHRGAGRSGHATDELPPGPDAPLHHHHHEEHGDAHGHAHSDGHGHSHAHGDHHHHIPETTWKGLAGMGISAGIIPCPTALVVLLAAITQDEIALGLLLIVVFSIGLAATLTGLGLAVVYAKRVASRVSGRVNLSNRVTAALPALSTLVILGLGIVLTAKAIPDVV